jgi:dihydrodipicolinate synthase/N-acetylneuraminate lyase
MRTGPRDGLGARLHRRDRSGGHPHEDHDLTIPPMVPGRHIDGISAVLLPFGADGTPDWDAFSRLLDRTWAAGLAPAVNMDTGYVHLLTVPQREQALSIAQQIAAGRRFVAGAFIEDLDGDAVSLYGVEIDRIRRHGGTPIVFQSSALARLDDASALEAYRSIGRAGPPLLAFELGEMFAGFGRIYSADFFRRLLDVDAFVGLKHSSLDRLAEWTRLDLRDRHRPDFRVYTGNDLAIDMVFYGSDYLLGLSAFSVDGFAARDRLWCRSDARAIALNDLLQYLGQLVFRPPVPAYRHSAAQFLKLQGLIATDSPHPRSPRRPDSDLPILQDIARRLAAALAELS